MKNVCCEKNCIFFFYDVVYIVYVYEVVWFFFLLNDWEWNVNELFIFIIFNFLKFIFMFNVGKFYNYEFYFELDFFLKILENIFIMRFLLIFRVCFILGGVFWRFWLLLIICFWDKWFCSFIVVNILCDFVIMVFWRVMVIIVGL